MRHWELEDLLAAALIALEAGDRPAVERALRRALALVETDWLTTPGTLPSDPSRSSPAPTTETPGPDDEEDDESSRELRR
jgi:hypothetical protein